MKKDCCNCQYAIGRQIVGVERFFCKQNSISIKEGNEFMCENYKEKDNDFKGVFCVDCAYVRIEGSGKYCTHPSNIRLEKTAFEMYPVDFKIQDFNSNNNCNNFKRKEVKNENFISSFIRTLFKFLFKNIS